MVWRGEKGMVGYVETEILAGHLAETRLGLGPDNQLHETLSSEK